MYANASEAIEGLRHRRTGEILPTKNIARSTKLVYLDDACVGLRYHDTIIARYERDGVRLDTRDRNNSNGWFTVTTWDRIDSFTPARTFQRNGLRHMVLDPAAGGWEPSRLYAHGTLVSPNGSCDIPLEQTQSEAIERIVKQYGPKALRVAKKMVERWRKFEQPQRCCIDAQPQASEGASTDTMVAHYLKHFERNEPVVIPQVGGIADEIRQSQQPAFRNNPDYFANEISRRLAEELRTRLIPLAIAQTAPDFPYPQTAPRRR